MATSSASNSSGGFHSPSGSGTSPMTYGGRARNSSSVRLMRNSCSSAPATTSIGTRTSRGFSHPPGLKKFPRLAEGALDDNGRDGARRLVDHDAVQAARVACIRGHDGKTRLQGLHHAHLHV